MSKNRLFVRPAWKGRLRKEIRAAARVLILGIGNPAKGDDAAGLACARKLRTLIRGKVRSRLKILLGDEAPESLTGKIRDFNPSLVLVIDAADARADPGRIFIVEKDKIEDEGVSTHRISLALLVSYLEETVGCKVIVVGIQSLNLGFGRAISSPVEKAADKLAAYLAHIFLG